MPIADAFLDKPANAHLLCRADQTVYEALRAWRSARASYVWWWLVIDHGAHHYTALHFAALSAALEHPDLDVTMETALGDLPPYRDNPADWAHPLPGVVQPHVVDQDALSNAQALQQKENSPGRILIVERGGVFRGVLNSGMRTFAFPDRLLLDMIERYERTTSRPDDDAPPTPDSPPSTPPADNA